MIKDCKFCNILAKELSANVIFEDDNCISFLDTHPLFLGHSLLIPKHHYVTLYDMPNKLVSHLFVKAKIIGKAVERAMQAKGSFIAANNIVSQSIPHFHLHLVPRNKGDGLKGFFWPRRTYKNSKEMRKIQLQIIQYLL